MIDRTSSILASARSWRSSIDPQAVETKVPTATLLMWLDELISLGQPGHVAPLGDAHMRHVLAAGVRAGNG